MTSRIRVVFVLCLCSAAVCAAQLTPEAPRDTTSIVDSLRTSFMMSMGTMTEEPDSGRFSVAQFLWTDAFAPADLFRQTPGFIIREVGSPGPPVSLSAGGMDGRRIAWHLDGRPLSDPVTGLINLYDLPLEFIDHLEIVHDNRSGLIGSSGPGASINLVTRQYNTGRPVTKVRFMQGPDEHLLTDALFTQNILRPLNLMVGVQRHTSEDRFVNSRYDAWNLRTRLRYNISERLNISLTDLYRTSEIGVNNGIDIDSTRTLGLDVFNDAEAIVRSREAFEETTRRDLTLSAIARLTTDSMATTRATLYYSSADRRYEDPTGASRGGFDSYEWKIIGGSIRHFQQISVFDATIGGMYERQTVSPASRFGRTEKTVAAWFTETRLHLGFLKPFAGFRGERNGEAEGFSFGIGVEGRLGILAFEGGYSESLRFPSFQELNWASYRIVGTGSLNLKEKHQHTQVRATVSPAPSLEASLGASRRIINNAISFVPTLAGQKFPVIAVEVNADMTISQVFGELIVRVWNLEAKGGATLTETKKGSQLVTIHPDLVITGELSYRDRFFGDALDARFVLHARSFAAHQGIRYIPATTVFAENADEVLPTFSTLDLYGVFRIGDAFLTITWQNPLERRYFTVAGYPALDRNVRIGLNWVFLD